jgi:hypothetical protein
MLLLLLLLLCLPMRLCLRLSHPCASGGELPHSCCTAF